MQHNLMQRSHKVIPIITKEPGIICFRSIWTATVDFENLPTDKSVHIIGKPITVSKCSYGPFNPMYKLVRLFSVECNLRLI
jgi:hypothetical protein